MAISLEFTDPKEAQALAAFQKVAGGLRDIESATQRLVAQGKTAKEAMQELGRPAEQSLRQAMTAAEKYGQALARIQELAAKGISPATAETMRAGAFEKYQGPQIRRDQHAAEAAAAKAAADSQAASEKIKQRAMEDTRIKQDELAAGARKTWDSTRTSVERATTTYKQRLLELSAQLKAGLIDQEVHARAVRQAKDEYDNAGKSQAAAFGAGAIAKVAALAASYLSVNTAIRLITASLEHKRRVEAASRDAAISVADAQREMTFNLSAKTNKEQEQAIARVEAINKAFPNVAGLAGAYKVVSAGLSATGSDMERASKNAEIALRVSPTNVDTAVQIAASLEDVRKMTGMGPEANMGYMLELGERAVSRKQEFIAGYLVPAAKKLTTYGATPEEAGAAVTALQGAVGERDVEGRLTGTAVVQLAKQMEEKLPTEDRYKTDVEGVKTLVAKGTGLKTFTERLRFLQENEEDRTRFLSEATFEAGTEVEVQQLVGARVASRGGAGNAKELYERNLKGFTPRAQWATMAQDRMTRVESTVEQKLAAAQRRVDETVGALQRTPQGREAAVAGVFSKENIEKIISASGAGFFGVKSEAIVSAMSEMAGQDPIKQFQGAMDRAVQNLEFRTDYVGGGIGGPPQKVLKPETDPKRLAAAKALRERTALLLKEGQQLQESLSTPPSAETFRPATATEKYGPPPAPVSVPTRVAPKPTALPSPRPTPPQDWEQMWAEKEGVLDDFANAVKEPDPWKAKSKRAIQEAAKNAADLGDVLRPQPLPGSASAAGPVFQGLAATVDKFGQLIAKFDTVADKFIESGRRSPLLGSAKEDA